MLYPLKFKPRLKERMWGGGRLGELVGGKLPEGARIGESWEISGVQKDLSVVANGFLKGNDIQELIEIYMGELVGEDVYARYGEEFPILVKFIDAREKLSVQVHPDDCLAAERHNAYGKTEMWYIIDCEPDSVIHVGFRRRVDEREYLDALAGGTVAELLNEVRVKPGDAFFIPPGTIHAIGGGVLLAEIQQTSDVTYRIYDWDRVDENGGLRQLHTELAFGAIDFGEPGNYDVTRSPIPNMAIELVRCMYFTTNLVDLDGCVPRNYAPLDSFVIYVCVEGGFTIETADGSSVKSEKVAKGESVLLPAVIENVTLTGKAKLLEIYIEKI